MIWNLLVLAVVGLVAGAIARLLVPGRQAIGLLGTMLLGIVGSFAGGFLAWAIFGEGEALQASGIIASIIGATIVLALYVYMGRRRRTVV